MLRHLFPRLTADRARGAELFAAATAAAREPHWYVRGGVPDTLDGRFRMLATIAALLIVRLEQEGADGELLSVALTERFVDVMDSEHRELGLGDPTLGRTVRKLVASLARRVELWRSAVLGQRGWNEVTRDSIGLEDAPADVVTHSVEALRRFWSSLQAMDLARLAEGRLE
jgi:cytochrome b pre-mRNA-processing protein 3